MVFINKILGLGMLLFSISLMYFLSIGVIAEFTKDTFLKSFSAIIMLGGWGLGIILISEGLKRLFGINPANIKKEELEKEEEEQKLDNTSLDSIFQTHASNMAVADSIIQKYAKPGDIQMAEQERKVREEQTKPLQQTATQVSGVKIKYRIRSMQGGDIEEVLPIKNLEGARKMIKMKYAGEDVHICGTSYVYS